MNQAPTYDSLKPKEKAFVDAYIERGFNATAAARAIGLKKDVRRAGQRLATKGHIRAAIDERLEEGGYTKAMVKCRLAEQAFSSMGDILSFETIKPEPSKPPAPGDPPSPAPTPSPKKTKTARIDLNKARRLHKLHLIAEIKQRTYWDKSKRAEVTEIEVKNYSAQAALFKLGDHFGIFDKAEAPKGNEKPQGVIRGPLRGQLTEAERTAAANELEPTQ